MDMRDQEFDDLFRSNLQGLEQEPAARVWEGITDGLNASGKKRRIMTWLSAAASIMVVIGAWAVLANKKPLTPVKQGKTIAVRPARGKATNNTLAIKTNPIMPLHNVTRTEKQYALAATGKKSIRGGSLKSPATAEQSMPVNTTPDTQPTFAPVVVANAQVPDDVQLSVKSAADIKFNTKADPLADRQPAFDKKDSVATVKRKHKIHNFGDLVNLVVDKLDKRKDKLIVFSSDDENDERITGVNLGIAKAKKGE